MRAARVLSTTAVVGAIGAIAALVFGMASAAPQPSADASPTAVDSSLSSIPATPSEAEVADTPSASVSSVSSTAVAPATTAAPPVPVATSASKIVAPAPPVTTQPKTAVAPAPAPAVVGQALPLNFSTGSATRVITVVAASTGSTIATLQAWDMAPGGGWLKHGGAVTAHVGSDGLSTSPSETRSATPIGSFTLTQAFGALGNPGTGLPYFKTDTYDWWVSESNSAAYNTHQRCSASGCAYSTGKGDEHLVTETPYYNYAVVIDYNTPNAGKVIAGAGSAFFLHVTDGQPTAGCVAIPQANLVPIMQWLTPYAAPRILIGVA